MWEANRHWDDEDHGGKTYDQKFYVDRAQEFAEGTNQDSVPRSRMPGYPWLIHFFHQNEASQQEQFDIYKRVNVGLSCFALAGLCLILCRTVGCALAIPITLIAAFSFFVFKATLVQPEISFFFLYFCVFLLMIRCLRQPDWRMALGLGLLTGILHLLKGSALPTIALFLTLAGFSGSLRWWKSRRDPSRRWLCLVHFSVPVCMLLGFLAVTGSFLRNSYRAYGSPFYDPNSRYYFWAESPNEMGALQTVYLAYRKPEINRFNYQDPRMLAFLPKWEPDPARRDYLLKTAAAGGWTVLDGEWDILPSFKNWRKSHTLKDATDRIWRGFFDKKDGLFPHNASHRNGYFDFVAIFALGAILVLALMLAHCHRTLIAALRENWISILFAVGSICGSLLLYAWWGQISNRNRFFLTQFIPILFCFALVIRWGSAHLSWNTLHMASARLWLDRRMKSWTISGPVLICILTVIWRYVGQQMYDLKDLQRPGAPTRHLNQ